MANYTSSNSIFGGLYEAGFIVNQNTDGDLDINITDDTEGLMLRIDSVLNDENGEEENRETELSLRIPEDQRSDFAEYLRTIATMIERPNRPVRIVSAELVLVITDQNHFWYEINGRYYDVFELEFYQPENLNIRFRIPIDVSTLTSKPISMEMTYGYLILMSNGDEIRIVASSENALTQPIQSTGIMNIPDLSRFNNQSILPALDLPNFNRNRLDQINNAIRNLNNPTYDEILRRFSSPTVYFTLVSTMNTISYFMYEIEGRYFYALSLILVDPIIIVNVRNRIAIDLTTLTSKLALLVLNDGWILLVSDGDEFRILNSSSESPNALDQPIRSIKYLEIPDLSYIGVELPNVLSRRNLPDFNQRLLLPLVLEMQTRSPTYNEVFNPEVSSGIINEISSPIINNDNSIIINGLQVNFIPFEEMAQMLSQNKIERYIIDPTLQYLTTPPNSVLTMFGKNGLTYLVKAQYDQRNNQIFQSV